MRPHDLKTRRLRVACGLPRMAGLSLVELMVAVTLGLLIVAGVVAVFANTSAARNETERTSRQIENGRYAAEILSDDLRLAGFYGELKLTDTEIVPVPTALIDPCSTDAADWKQAIRLHLQGYSASDGGLSCLLASHYYKSGTDVVVVRRVRTCAAGVAGCPAADASKPYLQVSLCASESVTTPYLLALGATATLHKKGVTPNCSADLVGLRQYFVNIYFISTKNGVGGAGDDVPTLKRLEFTGSGFVETTLVEGIERLHIEYGIDNAPAGGDGAPDVYTSNPSEYPDNTCDDACKVNNWMNVMTTKVFIVARNIDPSPGYTDTKTYTLGSVTVNPDSAFLNHRRHVYTALVRINNPAGRRDTP